MRQSARPSLAASPPRSKRELRLAVTWPSLGCIISLGWPCAKAGSRHPQISAHNTGRHATEYTLPYQHRGRAGGGAGAAAVRVRTKKEKRAHADAVPGPAAGRQRQTMVVAAPPRLARSLLRRPRAPLFIPSAGAGGREGGVCDRRPGRSPPRMSFCCSLGWVRPLPDRTASPHAAGRRGAATELIEQSLSLVGAGGRGEQTHPCCFNGGALL
jgi:hypothetical protein